MNAIYLTVLNLALCTAWGFGSFLRLRASHYGVLCRVRVIYAGMLVAATASGFQLQLFGEYAGYADITVSTTMVGFIALGSKRWRYGAPTDLMKRPHTIL
jgi:hypothetical protein